MNTIIKDMMPIGTTWENIRSEPTSAWQCVDSGVLVTWIEPIGRLHASYGKYHLTYTFGPDFKPNEVAVAYDKMRDHLLDMDNTHLDREEEE